VIELARDSDLDAIGGAPVRIRAVRERLVAARQRSSRTRRGGRMESYREIPICVAWVVRR